MIGELKRKSTRTVHGEKVVRLRIDVPYEEIQRAEREEQDILEWLDARVGTDVNFDVGPFEDEEQVGLSELEEKAAEVENMDVDEMAQIDEL